MMFYNRLAWMREPRRHTLFLGAVQCRRRFLCYLHRLDQRADAEFALY